MNDFNVNGYLGEEIHSFIAAHKEQYKIQYSLNEILVKYFIDKTLKLELSVEDKRAATIGCLILKILNACQGVVIISQYGLDMEAHAILRTAFESYVYLYAIIKNDNFYNDYRNTINFEMKKIGKALKEHPEVVKEDFDVFDERTKGAKKITIKDAFIAAEMEDSSAIDAVNFQMTNYNKIIIQFTKTATAHRRIRLVEVMFGLIIQYSKDNLESASLLKEIDNTGATLPISELTLNIDNLDKQYNLLNPSNLFQYLQDGQTINISVGIGDTADNIEYADMGAYYFKSNKQSNNIITKLTAQDLMMYLDKKPYTTGGASTVTFSAFVAEIVSNSGLTLTTSIPAAVSALVINKNLLNMTCRAALALACAAVRCVAYFDKSVLIIKQLSNTSAVDELDDDNMFEVPSIEIPERYNKCEVSNDSGVLYTYNNVGARETPLTLKVKNPCLTAGLATAFAQWRLAEENRKLYKIHSRGNPERTIAAAVKVYDAFNVNNNVIITKQELIFNGGLEENLEGVY